MLMLDTVAGHGQLKRKISYFIFFNILFVGVGFLNVKEN